MDSERARCCFGCWCLWRYRLGLCFYHEYNGNCPYLGSRHCRHHARQVRTFRVPLMVSHWRGCLGTQPVR